MCLQACSSIDFHGNYFNALIYEFMVNRSLEEWLHPKDEAYEELRYLNIVQRLNIDIDVTSALDYLHYHCPDIIAHFDLKPSNVLLNYEMIECVADFGLA